ncbi:SLC13 family permease [Roseibium suaedae]|uniref:Di-and tricarboxylate transporter n=1 Tax=Roseibium suaedae TaxID=735517 RepID=A0A1M7CUQ8_9HYPH|nr:SLC13 family permease [Roseibium suaedae]SHL70991.1 Di-and tricarboxylate transporter [Roseibium suaedae]
MQALDIPMAMTFLIIAATVVLYATERYSIELIALGSVVAFMVLFAVFPASGPDGPITAGSLLSGFSNPAVVTVICLLIIGQGLFQTDALEKPAQALVKWSRGRSQMATIPVLLVVAALSAFLNNTPVVVMFLPILSAVAATMGTSPSRVLMPLSFMTILGGMTTVIGSSTNLLVANYAAQTSDLRLTFFSFTPIALILATAGSIYVLFIMPRLLKARRTMAEEIQNSSGKQFIAQINIGYGHPLVGVESISGMFPALKDMTVRLVQRGEQPLLPPFENVILSPGDTVIVAATRNALANALSRRQPLLEADPSGQTSAADAAPSSAQPGTMTLAEVVVAPASRMTGRTLVQTGFHADTGCVVMGIQRRSRMPRMAMNDIRLEAGDVLLIAGTSAQVSSLRGNRDVLLLDWSTAEVPRRRYAPRALAIFLAVVAVAAVGIAPIAVTAVAGTFAMIASGCLNIRQALRAIDSRILMLVGSSLAGAAALEATGGAAYIANGLVEILRGSSPTVILSSLFMIVMILTNFLSNNAAAVLFTPIAIKMANQLGQSPEAFVVCLIFAANASFATPIGYQTNLIVMGPGHYRFSDFLRAGTPLSLILWLTFSLVAPWYYGL